MDFRVIWGYLYSYGIDFQKIIVKKRLIYYDATASAAKFLFGMTFRG